MMKKTTRHSAMIAIAVIIASTLFSCNPARKYEKEERELIDNYLANNPSQNFVLKPSGLYYLEIVPGTGDLAVKKDTAHVKYTLKLLDGTVFDTNTDKDTYLIFPVAEGFVIGGLDEGITYMRQGGKSLMLMPSSLAYGPGGWWPIPGYTPLLLEAELVILTPGP